MDTHISSNSFSFAPEANDTSQPRSSPRVRRFDHQAAPHAGDPSQNAPAGAAPAHEHVFTIDDLADYFNVAPKTISRWRKRGLIADSFVVDGRRRIGFLRSSVDQFLRKHPEHARRDGRFSRLTDEERAAIIEQALRLAEVGASPTDLVKEIAAETGRCAETIRSAVRKFDRQHPEQAILADGADSLSDAAKDAIYTRYLRGDSLSGLARQYGISKRKAAAIIRRQRAERLGQLPLDYMSSAEFEKPNAEATILAPLPEPEHPQRKTRVPDGLPSYLAALYDTPLLTKEQEKHLFRKFNYLKFKASQLHAELDPARPDTRRMDEIERLYHQAVEVKNRLIQSNLRLVVSIAKRYVNEHDDLFNLISDGNMSLIRAVEKFDYSLGNKFSTYASWAIKKNYARDFAAEFRHLDRFRTSHDETLGAKHEHRGNPHVELAAQELRESQVSKILRKLNDRERQIIESRFGLSDQREPHTLKEVANEVGVSKERIRQIELRAIKKLREAAVRDRLDVLPLIRETE